MLQCKSSGIQILFIKETFSFLCLFHFETKRKQHFIPPVNVIRQVMYNNELYESFNIDEKRGKCLKNIDKCWHFYVTMFCSKHG